MLNDFFIFHSFNCNQLFPPSRSLLSLFTFAYCPTASWNVFYNTGKLHILYILYIYIVYLNKAQDTHHAHICFCIYRSGSIHKYITFFHVYLLSKAQVICTGNQQPTWPLGQPNSYQILRKLYLKMVCSHVTYTTSSTIRGQIH